MCSQEILLNKLFTTRSAISHNKFYFKHVTKCISYLIILLASIISLFCLYTSITY